MALSAIEYLAHLNHLWPFFREFLCLYIFIFHIGDFLYHTHDFGCWRVRLWRRHCLMLLSMGVSLPFGGAYWLRHVRTAR